MGAVFLDMDGVILDSEAFRFTWLERFLRQAGATLPGDARYWHVGLSDHKIASELIRRYHLPLTAEECQAKMKGFFHRFYLEAEEMRPFPGLTAFLKEARRRRITTGLVSTTKCHGVLSVLNRFALAPLFDVIVGGEFTDLHKPAPDPYLCAAAFAGAHPSGCVVIEDSPFGIQAGKAAGMYTVGFTAGSIPQDVSQADETARGYQDLTKALDRWFPV